MAHYRIRYQGEYAFAFTYRRAMEIARANAPASIQEYSKAGNYPCGAAIYVPASRPALYTGD